MNRQFRVELLPILCKYLEDDYEWSRGLKTSHPFLHAAARYGHWVSVLKFPQKILPLGTITYDLCILSGFKTTLSELLTFQRKKVFMRPSRHVIPKCLSTKNYWKLLQQGGGTNIKTIHTYYDELGISLCIWVTSLPIVRDIYDYEFILDNNIILDKNPSPPPPRP